MEQVTAFRAESDALAQVIRDRLDGRWDAATQFKDWTVNDVLVHLHAWNRAADMALSDPDGFKNWIGRMMGAIPKGGLRGIENTEIPERGQRLFDLWQRQYNDMADRWAEVDPKTRVAWVGPSMSARSSITARQMETWAHGHEVFDLLGVEREETDRLKNIVVLGVNTFGFSYQNRGAEVPDQMPRLRLTAPSGTMWEFGEGEDLIEGPALGFAQAVTQTRHWRDTGLRATGPVATDWMDHAQCFAGPPEPIPAQGSRQRVAP